MSASMIGGPNNSNKRKRGLDQGPGGHPAMNFSNYMPQPHEDARLAEVLTKHNASGVHPQNMSGLSDGQDPTASDTANAALHYSMSAQPDQSYLRDDSVDHSESAPEPNFDIGSPNPPHAVPTDHEGGGGYALEQAKAILAQRNAPPQPPHPSTQPSGGLMHAESGDRTNSASPPDDSTTGQTPSRHKVGTEEWAANRRLAHKEVERRRREAINDGISELGKIVPGAERNKGSILHSAVVYIAELKDRQMQAEQKNNLEKMVFEQAIAEVTTSADKLKADVRELEAELERWRTAARAAGVEDPGR